MGTGLPAASCKPAMAIFTGPLPGILLCLGTATSFGSAGVDSGPLHALSNSAAGGNGVYRYSTSVAFPASTFNSNNYWVDVVFVPQ